MTTLARNVAANIAAAVFTGVLTLAAAPLVLRWLGAEAYGLVAFQTTVQTLLLLLDFGFSTAINREIAALSATSDGAVQTRSVMRTAMPFYGIVAFVFCAAMLLAAPLIAEQWLTARLPRETVVDSLRLMAIALAAQFLALPHTAGFLGLQRQVLNSGLSSLHVALRAGGGVAVAFATRDVRMFFAWQAIASVLQVVVLATVLRRVMPRGKAEFRTDLMRSAWGLARGVAMVSAMAAIVMQADKLAVSRFATLAVFGYYGMAALLALTTAGGAMPVANAVFPRFTQLVAQNDREELALAYRRAMQAMGAMVLPIACVLGVWSTEVLFVWTGDAQVASSMSGVAVLLVAGMAMNGLVTIPYMLQLAHRWTMPGIAANVFALATFVPAMFVAAARFGPFATAVVFASLHGTFLAFGLTMNARRVLPQSLVFFARDVAAPLFVSLSVAMLGHWLLPVLAGRVLTGVMLAITGALAFFATLGVTPAVREWVGMQRQRVTIKDRAP